LARLGLLIEANRCIGCDVCVNACKDEYEGNDYPPYSVAQPDTQYGYAPSFYPEPASKLTAWVKRGHYWMKTENMVLGKFPHLSSTYIPMPCMHCDNAPCQKAASGGAVFTRADGIVIVDPVKSSGQSQLVASCPYGAIYWNDDKGIPQKCTLCAHLVDQGRAPKCVDACPVKAIAFGDLDDPSSEISTKIKALNAEPLHPEFGTKPKVYYAGLPKPFLSGKVVDGRTGEYLKDATVVLRAGDGRSWTTTSDEFADFEFKNLKVGQMYSLEVTKAGMRPKKVMVYLDQAKDIGKMQLFPEGA